MPIHPDLRYFYESPAWRVTSLRIRKERAADRCECRGECGTDHAIENALGGRRELIDFGAGCVREVDPSEDRCSAFHGLAHPATGSRVVLTVAHLDHNPPSLDEERLRAFCQACHNRYDTDHRRRNAHNTRRAKKAAGDLFGETA